MTIFWIGCALAALASLAAWIADYWSMPADKPEDARFLEIKAAVAQWDEACKQARIRSGDATLERESDAASDRLWEVVRRGWRRTLDAAFLLDVHPRPRS